jgi:hypothetical protein
LCHLTIGSGLLQQVKDDSGEQIWLVRSDEFTFTASSAVPMTQVSLNGTSLDSQSGALAIRPMRVASITSSAGTVTVSSRDGNPTAWSAPQKLSRAMPQALWGAPVDQPSRIDPNGNLIDDCLVGLQSVSAKSTYTPAHTGQIDVAKAFTDILLYPVGSSTLPHLPISAAAPTVANDAAVTANARSAVINPAISTTGGARSEIVAALATMVDFPAMDEAMTGFDALTNFATDPLIGQLAVAA